MGDDFRLTGQHNQLPVNAIPVIVRRDQVDVTTLVPVALVNADIGDVRWRDLISRIKIPNGRHRKYATIDYKEKLTGIIAKARADLANVLERQDDDVAERVAELNSLIQKAEARLQGLGTWLGKFYDDGAGRFHFISRNFT